MWDGDVVGAEFGARVSRSRTIAWKQWLASASAFVAGLFERSEGVMA